MRQTRIPALALCAAVALTFLATPSPALAAPTGARPSAKAPPPPSATRPERPPQAMATAKAKAVPPATPVAASAPPAAPAENPSEPPQASALGAPTKPGASRQRRYNNINHPLTSIVVPIAFFLTIILLAGTIQYMGFRREQGKQQTLRLMVEKGVQIPVELISPRKRRGSDLRRGLILIGTGLGISLFLLLTEARSSGAFGLGLIPALIGAGYLLAHKLDPPRPDHRDPGDSLAGAGSIAHASVHSGQDPVEPGGDTNRTLDADDIG